jgi:hypothetical protein
MPSKPWARLLVTPKISPPSRIVMLLVELEDTYHFDPNYFLPPCTCFDAPVCEFVIGGGRWISELSTVRMLYNWTCHVDAVFPYS